MFQIQDAQKNFAAKLLILSVLTFTSMWTKGFYLDKNTHILTEARNFKTLLKENYAIALGSLLKKVERGIEHNVDTSLCYAYIGHFLTW